MDPVAFEAGRFPAAPRHPQIGRRYVAGQRRRRRGLGRVARPRVENRRDGLAPARHLACERKQIEAPRVNVSLTASAILDEVGTIRRVLARIAEDKSLRPDAKCEFTDCLGALSRKMKHILRTQVQPTSLRAARTKQEGYLPGLHGVRV